MSDIQGVVAAMRKDGKGICIDDVWYSDYDGSNLRGVSQGDEVAFDYVTKGRWNNIKGKVRVVGKGKAPAFKPAAAGKAWSNLGVELGHASNVAKDMAIAVFADSDGGVGSTDFYRFWLEHTEKVYKAMTALRSKYEAGPSAAPDDGGEEVVVKKAAPKPAKSEAIEEAEDIF